MATVMPKADGGFAARVAAAQHDLPESIMRAGLQKDPYRHVHEALAGALGILPELVTYIEATRQPVRDEELNRSVLRGLRSVSADIVKAMTWQTAAIGIAALLIMFLVGAGVGLGIGFQLWHTPELMCESQHGGIACYYWKTPAIEPVPTPPTEPHHSS